MELIIDKNKIALDRLTAGTLATVEEERAAVEIWTGSSEDDFVSKFINNFLNN